MPALIVEDGTGLVNANSWGSLAEADAYFLSHPFYADAWDNLGQPEKETLLIRAVLELQALMRFRGYVTNTAQGTAFPRTGIYDIEGRLIASDAIPTNLKYAQFEMAFHLSRGDPYAPSSSEDLERLKIDVIELQFKESRNTTPVPVAALLLLNGLADYALGRRVQRVYVG